MKRGIVNAGLSRILKSQRHGSDFEIEEYLSPLAAGTKAASLVADYFRRLCRQNRIIAREVLPGLCQ